MGGGEGMRRQAFVLLLPTLLACAATPEPEPAAPAATALPAAVAGVPAPEIVPLPPEFPAVVVRLKQIDGRFVAEVIDVRGADPDPRPLEGDARRDAVRRLETLLGDRARVVDRDS